MDIASENIMSEEFAFNVDPIYLETCIARQVGLQCSTYRERIRLAVSGVE